MMLCAIDWLLAYLIKHKMVPEDEREIYAYSLEVALSAAIFWLMMAVLTLIFGRIGSTVIYLSVFFFCAALSAAIMPAPICAAVRYLWWFIWGLSGVTRTCRREPLG